jgi:hypothetical protein
VVQRLDKCLLLGVVGIVQQEPLQSS